MQDASNSKWLYSLVQDEDRELLNNLKIDSINVYKNSGKIVIDVSAKKLISLVSLMNIEKKLLEKFSLKHVTIKPKFNIDISLKELLNRYWEEILCIVNKKIALSSGVLHECWWELEDYNLTIKLKTAGSEILKSHKCDCLIRDIIYEYFQYDVNVDFDDYELDGRFRNKYFKRKENLVTEIVNNVIDLENVKSTKNNTEKQSGSRDENGIIRVIKGKRFNEPAISMAEINEDSGKVVISGDIFRVSVRELRKGNFLYIFDVTDYTSSLTVKTFVKKDKIDDMTNKLKEGISVSIRGESQYDKYSKDIIILAYDILEMKRKERVDTAYEKRVELHLHTKMSSMDGISSVKDIVKRAKKWGHKAVAITDHGVLQAYPEAFSEAGKDIKIIYGVECYLVDNHIPIVYRSHGQPVGGDYVVFDIETTGLDALRDKITEIGAVKIRNGIISEKYSSFVNPEVAIPENIVKLTGISDNMVKDAPAIEKVIPEFLEFVGECPLVAHNATFDYGFIKQSCKKAGINTDNTLIDTLQLSRKMFPGLKKYKLSSIAKSLKIESDTYHRAIDDSLVAAKIFIKCIDLMKQKNIKITDDIEKMFKDDDKDVFKADTYHAIILAKNKTGLKNLYRIVSESHLKYFFKKPRVPKKLIHENREGLIIGTACEAGELYRALLENRKDCEIEEIIDFYDYLEIQPLGNNNFLIRKGKVNSGHDLKNINKKIVKLGERFKKPVVATGDVHFLDERDEVFRRIIMAGQGYDDADEQAPLFFRTTEEMLEEFKYLGDKKAYETVVVNTNKIADKIDYIAPIPEDTFPPKMEGSEHKVKEMAENNAKERYGEKLPDIVRKRLDKELDSIISNGFAVMYHIAQKLVYKSLEDGYIVGSRGSVGSSFVAYTLGITEVNSLQPHYLCEKCKYCEFITDGSVECGFDLTDKNCPRCGNPLKKDGLDIPFETFLGFEGDKEPDIDLNFSGEYQPVVHKYTEKMFGRSHVFRAGTITTIASKTAYGFVRGYLDDKELVVTNAEVNRLVDGCTGIKRTTGQHPGGLMVIPGDMEIYDFSPIQRPADDTNSDVITTHFDYNFLHGCILKLDILGHTVPTILKMLEDLTKIKATEIPLDEEKTMSLFSSTKALGVKPDDINSDVGTFAIPEMGTSLVRPMLKETRPKKFSELIRISGLSHGTGVWRDNAQDLVKSGKVTLSEAICCRDDIMLYLIYQGVDQKTAFFITEDVRHGDGLKPEYEKTMRDNGVPEWYIDSCKKIQYMFPKAHASAYVMNAFRIAWFKVYYPREFYITYFTICAEEFDAEIMTHGREKVRAEIKRLKAKGNDLTQREKNLVTILEVVNEMYARGIKFLPVDLYDSDAVKFLITKEGIRPPLKSLQGLGVAAARNIVRARKKSEFSSVEDLKLKSRIGKGVIDILRQHGCLNSLRESDQMSFFAG